jgi:NADPH:quinone reductase-like Zn-dependent oxidoreductase
MRFQQVIVSRHGDVGVLQVAEAELQEPQIDQVRVRVLHSGVAFTDILIREGLYPGLPPVPFVPGYTIVGVIDRVGSNVTSLRSGQRVAALTVVGGYSEFICLPVTECVLIPDEVDSAAAVCLVLQYVTAYQLLHRIAKVRSGDSVLIHGAAGGVGTALLELGHLAGLEMYGTASRSKHSLVKRLGGCAIDYQTDDFVEHIHTLTGTGVDVVFDGIGGWHLVDSYRCLQPHGQLVNYGFSAALATRRYRSIKFAFSFLMLLLLKLLPGRRVHFYSIASLKQRHPEWFQEDLTQLLQLLAAGKIHPVISDRLPLKAAAEAHRRLEEAAVSGQLVLQYGEG